MQPIDAVVRTNAWRIAAGYFPGGVIADRTATTFRPADDGSVFLVADRRRDVQLPGLRLRARAGPGPLSGDAQWMGENLFMSSPARASLDNLRPSRARTGVPRTLTREEFEQWLEAQARDPRRLNRLRDQARALAPLLAAEPQLAVLDGLIGAFLGTRDLQLEAPRAAARARGVPYDQARLERFEDLHAYLLANPLASRPTAVSHELSTFAFFESYFSNFIEGTEFTVDEAEEIVFRGVVPDARPRDAHDILGTYRIVADPQRRRAVPDSADAFERLLQESHALMLGRRPEAGPGVYKDRPNRADGTVFVEPELVRGTLREAYRRFYPTTEPGLARAAFMLFVVAEVHPFADGNGRIARIAANAELTAVGEQRLIVTVRDRDDYLQALRGLTHNADAAAYAAVVSHLQAATATTDYSNRDAAQRDLTARGAFDEEPRRPLLLRG